MSEASSVRASHRLLLLAAAFLFSTGGAAIKAAPITGWQVASFRSAVAAVFLLIALPDARRNWTLRMAPVAIAYAATLISFVVSTRLTTAANAIILQSTAPLYVLLLSPLVLHERIGRADLLYMAAVAVGMIIFFTGSDTAVATAPDPARGNLVALVSGVSYACMLIGLRWLARVGKGDSAVATIALGNALACVLALPWAVPFDPARLRASLLVILYLGVIQIGVAYFCLTRAIRHVPAVEATTLLMLEPALNPVITWLVHGEKPGVIKLTGGAVILIATVVNTWRQSRLTAA
jgi:drug/metabolite transporter (DMT)-like permease